MKRISLFSSFVPILCAVWLDATTSVQAEAWVARHGITGAQYQTEFNQWTAAPYYLRPVCVSGYEVSGEARYAALFGESNGSSWSAVHGWNETDFNTQVATMRNQGWRPVYYCAFGVGSAAYYTGIFEPTSNTDFLFYSSLTWTEYTSTATSLGSQGYHLSEICPFNIGAADYYAALFEKTRGITLLPPVFYHRQTGAQYQTTFNSMTGQGYRLVGVRGFTVGGETRFTSHWAKPAASDWWSYNGMSAVNYQGEVWNAAYQGYRPTFIDAYTGSSGTEFNAIWNRNGGFNGGILGTIDNAISAYMQQYSVPGLTLAISYHGRLVFARGYGYADQGAGETVHPLHRFRIASVSKPFCATAMLTLVDANLVNLSNTVFGAGALLGTTYGNGIYTNTEKQITVRECLNHTTGWIGASDNPIWDNANGNNTAAVIGQALDDYDPSYPPGTHYEYHNVDFCVAARVIERITGKTFEQYVKDTVLAPCGISDMEIGNQTLAGRKLNEVVYYDIAGRDPYVDINPHRMDANGGWIATAMDLLLFGRRIDGDSLQHDVLSSSAITSMRTGSTPNPTYGLGWFWDGGRAWYGHNGCMTGTLGWLIERGDGIQIAAITNLRPSADDCAWNLNAVLMGIGDDLNAANAWPSFDLFPSSNPGFDGWVNSHFDANAIAQLGLKESIWGPSADPDGDGDPNIAEAYLNHDPLGPEADFHGTPFFNATGYVFRWLRPLRTNGVEDSVTWAPRLTGSWSSSSVTVAPVPRMIAPVGFQWMDATLPKEGRPTAFMKLDLTLP